MIDNIYSYVRKLAKSDKYQTIYSIEKPLGIRLFENTTNLSHVQVAFLNYLSLYSILHTDIYMDEVSDIVLKDEIYEDAYFFYKHKKRKTEKNTGKRDNKVSKNEEKETKESKTQWIFRKPKKK